MKTRIMSKTLDVTAYTQSRFEALPLEVKSQILTALPLADQLHFAQVDRQSCSILSPHLLLKRPYLVLGKGAPRKAGLECLFDDRLRRTNPHRRQLLAFNWERCGEMTPIKQLKRDTLIDKKNASYKLVMWAFRAGMPATVVALMMDFSLEQKKSLFAHPLTATLQRGEVFYNSAAIEGYFGIDDYFKHSYHMRFFGPIAINGSDAQLKFIDASISQLDPVFFSQIFLQCNANVKFKIVHLHKASRDWGNIYTSERGSLFDVISYARDRPSMRLGLLADLCFTRPGKLPHDTHSLGLILATVSRDIEASPMDLARILRGRWVDETEAIGFALENWCAQEVSDSSREEHDGQNRTLAAGLGKELLKQALIRFNANGIFAKYFSVAVGPLTSQYKFNIHPPMVRGKDLPKKLLLQSGLDNLGKLAAADAALSQQLISSLAVRTAYEQAGSQISAELENPSS